jgi:hypothetical protein
MGHGALLLDDHRPRGRPRRRTRTRPHRTPSAPLPFTPPFHTAYSQVVLANELGVATFAVGIGHVSTQPARSFGTSAPDGDNGIVERSLKAVDFSAVVECFLAACDPDTRPAAFVHTRPARSAATRRGLGEGAVWLCSGALVAAGVAAAVLALGALVRRRT